MVGFVLRLLAFALLVWLIVVVLRQWRGWHMTGTGLRHLAFALLSALMLYVGITGGA